LSFFDGLGAGSALTGFIFVLVIPFIISLQ
jgi:hypothetical protein